MNVIIRCLQAAAESTQRIERDAGDYYANKAAAARVWGAALAVYDQEPDRDPKTRKYIFDMLESNRYVGD